MIVVVVCFLFFLFDLHCPSLNAVFLFSRIARQTLVYTRGSRIVSISLFKFKKEKKKTKKMT